MNETQLTVSCPNCHNSMIVDMAVDGDYDGPIKQLINQFIQAYQGYSFSGGGKCTECGRTVMAALTVSVVGNNGKE